MNDLYMSVCMLAINTTTVLCSVALLFKNHIYDNNVFSSGYHSEKILPMIHQLLIDTGITLKSLDCIVFDIGPGNFVGIRVGISIVQGLSLGVDLPLIPVSSLEILAQGSMRLFCSKKTITVIDAPMGKLYWAHYSYQESNGLWLCKRKVDIVKNSVVARKLICTLRGKWVLVGTGWNNYLSLYYVSDNDPIILRSIMFPIAKDMISIGLHRWKNKSFCFSDQVQPMYIYETVAMKKYL